MGLDTRQTRPSRDGGVDCVAFDQRAIFGGKVVIQAKRYRHTVGVSAVRDLYGTVMNEGASKGILVTTSGYGRASMEFANGKPLELLDGANLLSLLAEYAGIEAKIVPPDNWVDPIADVAETNNWPAPALTEVTGESRSPSAASTRPRPKPATSTLSGSVADNVVATPAQQGPAPTCSNAACSNHGHALAGRQCPVCFHYAAR